jgi:tetratricopeptide (TPR) repeat protein
LTFGEELLAQAERGGDESARLAGRWAASLSHYFLGEFAEAVHDADSILSGYDAAYDRQLKDLLGTSPKTAALAYKACAQWMLGYPDSAARLAEEAFAWARDQGAYSLAWALHFLLFFVFQYRRERERCRVLQEEFERIAHEQGLLFYERIVSPLCRAVLFALLERPREAEAEFRVGIPRRCEAGMGSSLPLLKTWHAVSEVLMDRLDRALVLVEEALEQIQRPGWEERSVLSEALRVKGWILERGGDVEQAEAGFQEAIGVARGQRAKSFELRAATSLARLWQSQGKGREAYELLAPVYAWFTEGFDTADLKDAKALLDQLVEAVR